MGEPIRVKPHTLEPDAYVRTFFRFNLSRLLLVMAFLIVFLPLGMYTIAGPTAAMVLAFWLLLGCAAFLKGRHNNLRNAVTNPLNRHAWGTRSVEFADDEVRSVVAGMRSQITYDSLVNFGEAGPFYLVYFTQSQYLILPKSSFETPADEQRFLALMKSLGLVKRA